MSSTTSTPVDLPEGQPLPHDNTSSIPSSTTNDTSVISSTTTTNIPTAQPPVTLYTIEPFVISGSGPSTTASSSTKANMQSSGEEEAQKPKRGRGRPPKTVQDIAREWIGVPPPMNSSTTTHAPKKRPYKRKSAPTKPREPPIDTFALWQILNEKYAAQSRRPCVPEMTTTDIVQAAMTSADLSSNENPAAKKRNKEKFMEPGFYVCVGDVRPLDVSNDPLLCDRVNELFSTNTTDQENFVVATNDEDSSGKSDDQVNKE